VILRNGSNNHAHKIWNVLIERLRPGAPEPLLNPMTPHPGNGATKKCTTLILNPIPLNPEPLTLNP
jgi:hypothetical protein